MLEKRVKSRFSHRQIFLYPGDTSGSDIPVSAFEDRLELFESLLSLPDDENVNKIEEDNAECNIDDKFRAIWNDQIRNLKDNPTIVNVLKQMHKTDRTERKFRNFLAVAISSLCSSHQQLEVDDFVQASKIFSQNAKILILEGLSVLEMCLVIKNIDKCN
jgi:origin recognition complex subunit 4